jgi:hypothetical protein
MKLTERIESFSELGEILRNCLRGKSGRFSSDLEKLIYNQQFINPWFTPENVRMAVNAISDEITYENLTKWTNSYPALDSVSSPENVGVMMAGNIPLVGFHDLLSVLISGNNVIAKTSSQDPELIVFIGDVLSRINPGFRDKITFTDGLLKGFDAVIATGSNNSSRYFEYYFGKYPRIIRKNRNSVAVIEGDETDTELGALGSDIFSYFGLGCRNVSKIYFPESYEYENLATNWAKYSEIINHNKYANNYDYNKAIYLVSKEEFSDTGYLLLKKSSGISSPVAVLFFEHYLSLNDLHNHLGKSGDQIQCIISKKDVPFGMAQAPRLWDYADGIDTLEFLLKKNIPGIL